MDKVVCNIPQMFETRKKQLVIDTAIQPFPCSICGETVKAGEAVITLKFLNGDVQCENGIPLIAHYLCAPEPTVH